VNGVVAVPIMVLLIVVATNRAAMGELTLRGTPRAFAWAATLLMSIAVVFMFVTLPRA